MGIPTVLTSAFSFGIRANRFFSLYKIFKVMCMPSAFPMQQHRPCLLHGALQCLLRELWGRHSLSSQGLLSQLLAQGLGLKALPVPSPRPVSLWMNLSSHVARSTSPSVLGVLGVLRLCGSWGRHCLPFLGVGFQGEPWATSLGGTRPLLQSYVQRQSGGLRRWAEYRTAPLGYLVNSHLAQGVRSSSWS